MNHNPHDELQDEALSALYQTTRDGVEPPPWLDDRILTAARAAVAPRPVPTISRFRRIGFWAAPVALAATLIMTVGIVQWARETGEWQTPMEMKRPSSAKPAAEMDAASVGRLELHAVDRALPVAPPASPAPKSVASMPLERRKADLLQEAPATMESEAAVRQLKAERSPEEWLADIAELRRQGRTAEAEASLTEFRRRYPDYPQGEIEK